MHRIDESSPFNCMHRLKGWHLIKRIVLSHRVTFRSFSGKIFCLLQFSFSIQILLLLLLLLQLTGYNNNYFPWPGQLRNGRRSRSLRSTFSSFVWIFHSVPRGRLEYPVFDKYEGKLFLLFKGNEREGRGGGKFCFVDRSIVLIDLIYYVKTLYPYPFIGNCFTEGDTHKVISIHFTFVYFVSRSTFTFPRCPPRWIKNVTYPRRRVRSNHEIRSSW